MTVLQRAIAQANENERLVSAIEEQGSLQPWQQDRIVEPDPGAFGLWLLYRHGKGIDLGAVSCAQAMMSFNLQVVHASP
ncbi:hypothetical protein AWB74_04480 [Caballeronia arvi]|uniref:Uncharacterized protein n=1 Tax=Caballeronia arvi TaxID=1777135 RepID=A0A158JY37_9BURK|nr:hypothetical protein [Caballeronia arvi]SAL73393.1 hypothetical protein AWB74_04480 [Caballeronia arvi]